MLQNTSDLLLLLNPDNPRDHGEDDIQETALSLLEAGWAEVGVSRQKDGLLIGGHGRVLAADWLSKQTQAWFDKAWKKWSKKPERAQLLEDNKGRFNPEFWRQCPVQTVNLDEQTLNATMIRLNNPNKDGRDNPKKIAALLAKMGKPAQDQAGYNPETVKSLISAFCQAQASPASDDEDYPDDEDYAGDRDSGEGEAYMDDDAPDFDADGNEDVRQTKPPSSPPSPESPSLEIVDLDDDIEDISSNRFNHTATFAPTRFILYCSELEKERIRLYLDAVAEALEIDTQTKLAKNWRTDAFFAGMAAHITPQAQAEIERKLQEYEKALWAGDFAPSPETDLESD